MVDKPKEHGERTVRTNHTIDLVAEMVVEATDRGDIM